MLVVSGQVHAIRTVHNVRVAFAYHAGKVGRYNERAQGRAASSRNKVTMIGELTLYINCQVSSILYCSS